MSATLSVYVPKVRNLSTVGVVVEITNPSDAPPWEPTEGRIVHALKAPHGMPAAIRAVPNVIPPGQRGRIALVFDRDLGKPTNDDAAMEVEILREHRPEFALQLFPKELRGPAAGSAGASWLQ